MTHRHALTDSQWKLLSNVLPRRRGPAPKLGDRLFVDAVLYRLKTGSPWRDLPTRFGPWKTVYNRFALWSRRRHWEAIFKCLQLEYDEEGVLLDASVVRAHQDASGGKGGSSATLWVVHVVDSPRNSTRSSTRSGARSTSRSPRGNSTNRPSPKSSSNMRKAGR